MRDDAPLKQFMLTDKERKVIHKKMMKDIQSYQKRDVDPFWYPESLSFNELAEILVVRSLHLEELVATSRNAKSGAPKTPMSLQSIELVENQTASVFQARRWLLRAGEKEPLLVPSTELLQKLEKDIDDYEKTVGLGDGESYVGASLAADSVFSRYVRKYLELVTDIFY